MVDLEEEETMPATPMSGAMTTPAVVDLEEEETAPATRTPAKRRLGLGGSRLGRPMQAQSPS